VPLDPFPIVDVSQWEIVADETSGAEEKYWLQEPGIDVLWLFKTVTVKDGHVNGEDWAEKSVSHLAELIEVPCARIEPAEMRGRTGSISKDLRPRAYELQHGRVLLEECDAPGFTHPAIAAASTTPMLSLPSPASVPAAISDASPRAGTPAPMVMTSTNKTMYSNRLTAGTHTWS
jgi:hypothetical protein